MIIQLDLQSDVPIYLQLKHQIIEGIATKQFGSGDELPSVRAMAADLGVNMQTVNKTYQLLKADGFVQIHRQKGVVVHPEGVTGVSEENAEALVRHLRPLISESICRGMRESEFQAICSNIFTEIEMMTKEEDR